MHVEKKDFNKDAGTWDQKTGRVKLAHDVAYAIMNEVKPTHEMDVLDFGCGTGLLTLQLQPLVRSITGVDSSQGMIDVLNSKIDEHKLINVKTVLIVLDCGYAISPLDQFGNQFFHQRCFTGIGFTDDGYDWCGFAHDDPYN